MGFNICPLFKVGEENKIARLVKEDKLITLLKPDLNPGVENLTFSLRGLGENISIWEKIFGFGDWGENFFSFRSGLGRNHMHSLHSAIGQNFCFWRRHKKFLRSSQIFWRLSR